MNGLADDAIEDEYRADGVKVAFLSPAFGTVCPAGFRPAAPLAQRRQDPAHFFRTAYTNKATDFTASHACPRKEKIGDFMLELFQPTGQNNDSIL
jgi:hypothetical protein